MKKGETLKHISIATANKRLGAIRNTFGSDSEMYRMASNYVESHVDEKYLVRDEDNNLLRIKAKEEKFHMEDQEYTTKNGEIKTHKVKVVDKEGLNLGDAFGRSNTWEENLPTVTQALKQIKDENNIEGSIKDNKKVLVPLANIRAAAINLFEPTVSDIYEVANDDDALAAVDPENAARLQKEAEKLIDEKRQGFSSTSELQDWIYRTSLVVQEYNEASEDARR